MGVRPSKLKTAMTIKGYVLKPGKKHDIYIFYYNGIKTDIRTMMSRGGHGSKEFGDTLMSDIKKQMRFDNNEQLISYSECTFTLNDYTNMLSKNGDLLEYESSNDE